MPIERVDRPGESQEATGGKKKRQKYQPRHPVPKLVLGGSMEALKKPHQRMH